MRRASVLIVILLSLTSWAWSSPQSFALKQQYCDGTGEPVILTAVPYNHEGRSFLVTPLQLLSPEFGSVATCFEYLNSQGIWQTLEFRGVDWPYLAVFESSQVEPEPEWDESQLRAPMAISAQAVDRETLSSLEQSGFVASLKSDRGLKKAGTELRLGHLSSEMVGGLVKSPKSGKSLGILSGHWMQFQPNGPSILRSWQYDDQGLSIPGTYFLISPSEIKESIAEVIAGTDSKHRIISSPAGAPSLVTGELQLKLDCPEASDDQSGDFRFPIGGIDMVGIGGESQARGCVIRVSKADKPTLTHLSWLDDNGLYKNLLDQIHRGNEVELHYIFKEGSERGLPSTRSLLFNLETLQWGIEQGRQALRLVFASGNEHPGADPEDEDKARLAAELLRRSSVVFSNYRHSNASGTLELLREIYFVARVMQSDHQESLIDPAYLQRLLNDQYYERAWFFITHSMTGGDPELRRLFEELI